MKDVKLILLTMKVKNFIKEGNYDCIKYNWDDGHSYSYVDHPLMEEVEECDELEGKMYDWLYENDEKPPCQIHVNKDGTVGSSCGCHDHLDPVQESDEISDILHELTLLQRENDDEYLITSHNSNDFT